MGQILDKIVWEDLTEGALRYDLKKVQERSKWLSRGKSNGKTIGGWV